MKRFLIDSLLFLGGKTAFLAYSILGWGFICLSGQIIGNLFFYTRKSHRTILEKELKSLFGSRFSKNEIQTVMRNGMINHYTRHVESLFLGVLTPEKLKKVVTVEGLGHLEGALAKKKGVILLLSHFGSFLLPLPVLGYLGYPVNQVAGKQIHTSLISERIWFWRKREADKMPVRFIQIGKFLRPLYTAIKNNEIVAIAFDGRDSSKWVKTKLFEKSVGFSSGPFELARKTGAVILPTYTVRQKGNTHTIIIEPEFDLSEDTNGRDEALKIDTQRFSDIFARYLALYPCHFAMVLYIYKKMEIQGDGVPFFMED